MSIVVQGEDAYNLLASAFLLDFLTPYFMWFVNDGDYVGCYDSCGTGTFMLWGLFAWVSTRSTILFFTMLFRPGIHLLSDEELIDTILAVQWWGLFWSIVS